MRLRGFFPDDCSTDQTILESHVLGVHSENRTGDEDPSELVYSFAQDGSDDATYRQRAGLARYGS